MRNVIVENNSFSNVMQLLADGGGVYTNTPCPGCQVPGIDDSSTSVFVQLEDTDGGAPTPLRRRTPSMSS